MLFNLKCEYLKCVCWLCGRLTIDYFYQILFHFTVEECSVLLLVNMWNT